MSEAETDDQGRHAAPDDDPNSDPPPGAGDGGEHADEGSADDSDAGGGDDDGGDDDGRDDDGGDDGGDDEEGHGTRYPGADPEDKEEIAEEREKRLDPENRPDNVEVDNTDRDFDAKKGMFTDAEGYDEAEEKFPGLGEQGA